jgi:hypothetical protein
MTLGDILGEVARKDLAGGKKLNLLYEEKEVDGNFVIRLVSQNDPDAYIRTSVLYDVTFTRSREETENYGRAYFLSMVFNAGLYKVKREKKEGKIKPSN